MAQIGSISRRSPRPKNSSGWRQISLTRRCGMGRRNLSSLPFSITRWAKGNGTDRKHKPPVPTTEEQFRMEADFFDQALRNGTSEPIESSIQYYTMGEGKWHTTKTWPPAGVSMERLYFADHSVLDRAAPLATNASDSYTVDF